ncbi:hypothetical protein Cni_G28948 [Canna indica]|uniref:N-alpha-acetyltransferase 40 n=1 Tax=Canna indica TaxID=4628 RepID=A0AAQ3QSS3_9LILI|nr:hypothetical protein Cni_G28948 [Canna indica]
MRERKLHGQRSTCLPFSNSVAVSPHTRRLFAVAAVGPISLSLSFLAVEPPRPRFLAPSLAIRSPAVDSSPVPPKVRKRQTHQSESEGVRGHGRLRVDDALLLLLLPRRVESMEARRLPSGKEKKIKRKEVLEKKKAIDEIIKKASSVKDHLVSFPPFCHYERNGLSVYLESGFGDQLTSSSKKYIQNLLKVNMEGPYGSEWSVEEKVKRREMVSPEARYIFVRQSTNATSDEIFLTKTEETTYTGQIGDQNNLVGFVHYRFIVEEDIPVVYVYELQLEACAQKKGLGKFLMQLIELVARKNHMGAVLLTVQKANVLAMNFYTTKLRYTISTISPSRVDPLIGAEKSYEILCKTFDSEAKAKLEDEG